MVLQAQLIPATRWQKGLNREIQNRNLASSYTRHNE